MKTSEINIQVQIDENRLPVTIDWQATDSGMDKPIPCKALLLSIWDPAQKNTLRVDLWTKDMPLDEMKQFFFETLVTMADTYDRATSDEATAKAMREFANQYAELAEVIKK